MEIDFFEKVVMNGCPVFTNRQRKAAAFLDSKGLRFLIGYGFENCESIAESMGFEG